MSNIHNMVMFRTDKVSVDLHDKFVNVGMNTGNMVFENALRKNMHVDVMPFAKYISNEDAHDLIDAVLTTDLIWITPNGDFSYLEKQLDLIDKPFIPMSVGVQNSLGSIDYNINRSALNVLSRMQERAVIGVRGEITADILNKNGIKNIQVIGCPSMYFWNHPQFKVKKVSENPKAVTYNFRTFYGRLSKDEAHFLSYCARKNYSFVEQTEYELKKEMCPSKEYFDYVEPRINKNVFFDIESWLDYGKSFDFSIGARFHGNVISLWSGVPALFIMIDSRMKEMLEYFELPYIMMSDFDETKDIRYYYELADYSNFNKNYEMKFDNYISFMKKNNIIY